MIQERIKRIATEIVTEIASKRDTVPKHLKLKIVNKILEEKRYDKLELFIDDPEYQGFVVLHGDKKHLPKFINHKREGIRHAVVGRISRESLPLFEKDESGYVRRGLAKRLGEIKDRTVAEDEILYRIAKFDAVSYTRTTAIEVKNDWDEGFLKELVLENKEIGLVALGKIYEQKAKDYSSFAAELKGIDYNTRAYIIATIDIDYLPGLLDKQDYQAQKHEITDRIIRESNNKDHIKIALEARKSFLLGGTTLRKMGEFKLNLEEKTDEEIIGNFEYTNLVDEVVELLCKDKVDLIHRDLHISEWASYDSSNVISFNLEPGGMNCGGCGLFYSHVEANNEDGSYICYNCRG